MTFVCKGCGAAFGSFRSQCPTCQKYNTLAKSVATLGECESSTSPSTQSQNVTRLVSGIPWWDETMHGGGLVAGTSLLLGGAPGTGKSTIALLVAGGYARAGHVVLYASSEEKLDALHARATRIEATHANLFFASTTHVAAAKKFADEKRATIGIFDSVQEFERAKFSDFNAPATRILLSQLNATGAIHGTSDKEYKCDALFFTVEREGDDDAIYYVLKSAKNRNAPAGVRFAYKLTAKGVEKTKVPKPKLELVRADAKPWERER